MNSMPADPIPVYPLYHYTSLDGLLGIVKYKRLWATHVAYLNDSTELDYAVRLLRSHINNVLLEHEQADDDRDCLSQLHQWLSDSWVQNNLLFTCSFSEAGNLLSQWRAYCPPAGGVSLGFQPDQLLASADLQGYQLTKCVYDRELQQTLVEDWLRSVLSTKNDKQQSLQQAPPSQSWYSHFRSFEERFLNIAARMKDPAFSEEREWRLISKSSKNLLEPGLRFRAGKSRLIPYIEFSAPLDQNERLSLRKVYVGPAQDHNLSFQSISMFLTNSGARITKGVQASGIPLRTW